MEFSSLFVFKQNGPWNNVCWPSSKKTSLSRLKKKYGFYKVTILRFFQRETYDFRQKLQISPFFVFAQNELWNNVRWSSSKKTSPPKVQKYWIYRVTKPFFSKGIKPRSWSKVGIFLFACFWTKWALKWCFLIIQLENKPSQTKKYLFNTVDILAFSKGLTHDFGQNWRFHLSLVLDKIGVEIMSDDNPSRKEALLNYKNINFTKSPNCIFSIRLTHDFRQKLQVSSLFRNFLLVCFWTIEA